jgi:hypothetical protein
MSDQPAKPATLQTPAPDAWGSYDQISDARRADLDARAEEQAAWVASAPDAQRDMEQSAFWRERLTGAEVFYLAARAFAGPDGDLAAATARLRSADRSEYVSFDLSALHLEGVWLDGAHLEGAWLNYAHLEEALLVDTHLEGAFLGAAHLVGARLDGAHLEGALLTLAYLEGALLTRAHLEAADLRAGRLERATLGGVRLSEDTQLVDVTLGPGTLGDWLDRLRLRNRNAALGGIKWHDADLTAVPWERIRRLGDERDAGWRDGARAHRAVVRAYRQVAQHLRNQGMADDADRFAYRAQIRQRAVLLRTFRLPQYLFSWLLAILAGYGYRPARTLFWYLVIVLGFAAHYVTLAPAEHIHLSFLGALVLSVSSFHGRGFFPGIPGTTTPLDSPLTVSAAVEAIIGLLIEISFIATFTQRFFGAK